MIYIRHFNVKLLACSTSRSSTHVDVEVRVGEGLLAGVFMWCGAVELEVAAVPLDSVQLVVLQVEQAAQGDGAAHPHHGRHLQDHVLERRAA